MFSASKMMPYGFKKLTEIKSKSSLAMDSSDEENSVSSQSDIPSSQGAEKDEFTLMLQKKHKSVRKSLPLRKRLEIALQDSKERN